MNLTNIEAAKILMALTDARTTDDSAGKWQRNYEAVASLQAAKDRTQPAADELLAMAADLMPDEIERDYERFPAGVMRSSEFWKKHGMGRVVAIRKIKEAAKSAATVVEPLTSRPPMTSSEYEERLSEKYAHEMEDAAPLAPPKVLTDEKAKSLARHFDEILKEGHGFTKQQLFEAALVYARDNGYLASAKADAEATMTPYFQKHIHNIREVIHQLSSTHVEAAARLGLSTSAIENRLRGMITEREVLTDDWKGTKPSDRLEKRKVIAVNNIDELRSVLSDDPVHEPEPATIYAMSRDYKALCQHLRNGMEVFGYATEKRYTLGQGRRKVTIHRNNESETIYIEQIRIGVVYMLKGEDLQPFIDECVRLDLEWIAPAEVKASTKLTEKDMQALAEMKYPLQVGSILDSPWSIVFDRRNAFVEGLKYALDNFHATSSAPTNEQ